MESDRDQRSTGCRFPFLGLRRNKVIPHNNEEETLQQLQPESVSNMEKRQRKLEEGRRQQDCETQMSTRKKIRKECKRDPGTEEMMTVKEIQDKKISDLM
ncbi:hypothetical protein SRHO_G00297540 [Serrasalmus rhombeus]